jgi:anti-anti-sigma factor
VYVRRRRASSSVSGLLEQGVRKFILNFRELPYIDSGGLGSVVHANTMVRRRAGTLVLLRPHQRIRALLDVHKLASVLEVFDSEDDALRSLGGTATTTGA